MVAILALFGDLLGIAFLLLVVSVIGLYIYLRAKGILGEPAGKTLE